MAPTETDGFDKSGNQSGETDGRDKSAWPVYPSSSGAAAFRNTPQGNRDHRSGQRNIDKKRPSPGSVLDEPATQNRTHCRRNRGEARPCPDRATAIILIKGSTDDRKSAANK